MKKFLVFFCGNPLHRCRNWIQEFPNLRKQIVSDQLFVHRSIGHWISHDVEILASNISCEKIIENRKITTSFVQEHKAEVANSADVPAIASAIRSLSAQLARNRALWNFGECYDNNNPTLPKSVFTRMTSHTPSLWLVNLWISDLG